MLVIFTSVLMLLSLLLTQLLVLIPLNVVNAIHFPWWFGWGLVALVLAWLIGD